MAVTGYDTELFPVMKDTYAPPLQCSLVLPIWMHTIFFIFLCCFVADHCVHYYDLRNTKQPIMVFKGHRKAVSYAKFVNGEEIVSA